MEKIRWGIIGCGGIARKRTLPGFLEAKDSECIAIMDASPAILNEVGDEFGIERRYDSVEALLADPDIEAVYIATPVRFHKENVFAAAAAGKHILCEKPMSLTVQDSEEMVDFCRQHHVKLGVGFMMRFHGVHEQMKKIIAEGGIGEVVTAYAVFNTQSPAVANKWRQTKASGGGGAMMDMGIHCIDLLRYMTGLEVTQVTALCGNQIYEYPDVEDAGTAVLHMNNGAVFTVQANFNIPTDAGGCSILIMGTKGSVTAQNTIGQTSTGALYYIDLGGENHAPQVLPYRTDNMYASELDAFSAAIRADSLPPVGPDTCIQAQKIIEAIYDSNDRGVHISLA